MKQSVCIKLLIAALVFPLIVAGCFSSNPAREGDGDGQGTGGGSSGTPMPPTSTPSQSGSQGQSGTRGRSAPNSTAGAPQSGDRPTSDSRQGSTQSTEDGGRVAGRKDGEDGTADIRVASAEKSGAGSNTPDATESDVGSPTGTVGEDLEVGVAEALEGANAAVNAAADAVTEAEAAVARARESASDSSGGGNVDSFDPWLTPGAGEQAATKKSAGGGGQPDRADGETTDSAAAGSGSDSASEPEEVAKTRGGRNSDDDSFDPFADYGEQAGAPRQPTGAQKAGSLQIADEAVAAARAALNRARRALITAAGAGQPGTGDADAEAVQLAAARAAMEAAAEAVIASAIAVMAASDAFADDTEYGDEAERQAGEDALADSIAKVVSIVQRDMRNAADALDATGELLAAAGTLMGMLSMGEQQSDEDGGSGTSPGDRVASLEEELDQSLAVFDDRMQSEGSSIVTGMAGEDSEITGGADTGANVDPRLSKEMSNQPGARNSDKRGGADLVTGRADAEWNAPRNVEKGKTMTRDSETQNEEFVIEDAGRGQDDDIVARQLREAAIAEQDPELREALWQEYKNYKESLETGEAEGN